MRTRGLAPSGPATRSAAGTWSLPTLRHDRREGPRRLPHGAFVRGRVSVAAWFTTARPLSSPLYLSTLALVEVRAVRQNAGPELAEVLGHPSVVLGELDAAAAAQVRPAAHRRRRVRRNGRARGARRSEPGLARAERRPRPATPRRPRARHRPTVKSRVHESKASVGSSTKSTGMERKTILPSLSLVLHCRKIHSLLDKHRGTRLVSAARDARSSTRASRAAGTSRRFTSALTPKRKGAWDGLWLLTVLGAAWPNSHPSAPPHRACGRPAPSAPSDDRSPPSREFSTPPCL